MKFSKLTLAMALMAFVLTGCTVEDTKDFWTTETCNTRLAMDVEDLEKYQVNFEKAKEQAEIDARSGNTKSAEANNKNAESWKQSTERLLKFYDTELLRDCDHRTLDQALVARIEEARKFLAEGSGTKTFEAEGMPDLRVTSVASTFVPYELDEYKRCMGAPTSILSSP